MNKKTQNKVEQSKSNRQEINQLRKLISNSYGELTNKYEKLADQREAQLFNSYMKILDQISEEVIRQQQRYLLIDKDQLLDDKCVKLCQDIVVFRRQCHRTKKQLNKVRDRLKNEKQKQQTIENQIYELQFLEDKKKQEAIQQRKSYFTYYEHLSRKFQPTKQLAAKKKLEALVRFNKSQSATDNPVQSQKKDYEKIRSNSYAEQPPLYLYKLSPKYKIRNSKMPNKSFTQDLRKTFSGKNEH